MDGLQTLLDEYDVVAAFWMTIKLTFFGAIGAFIIGTIIAIMRVSPVSVFQKFALAYVTLIRNTPLTLLVFFCAFGRPSPCRSTWPRRTRQRSSSTTTSAGGGRAVRLPRVLRGRGHPQWDQHRATRPSRSGSRHRAPVPAHHHHHRAAQAFRAAIAPLGNTLIALTKNTTVPATIGVAEPALMMRNMLEFNISLLYAIFFIMAAGFVILTLPMGLFFTWWSRKLA